MDATNEEKTSPDEHEKYIPCAMDGCTEKIERETLRQVGFTVESPSYASWWCPTCRACVDADGTAYPLRLPKDHPGYLRFLTELSKEAQQCGMRLEYENIGGAHYRLVGTWAAKYPTERYVVYCRDVPWTFGKTQFLELDVGRFDVEGLERTMGLIQKINEDMKRVGPKCGAPGGFGSRFGIDRLRYLAEELKELDTMAAAPGLEQGRVLAKIEVPLGKPLSELTAQKFDGFIEQLYDLGLYGLDRSPSNGGEWATDIYVHDIDAREVRHYFLRWVRGATHLELHVEDKLPETYRCSKERTRQFYQYEHDLRNTLLLLLRTIETGEQLKAMLPALALMLKALVVREEIEPPK